MYQISGLVWSDTNTHLHNCTNIRGNIKNPHHVDLKMQTNENSIYMLYKTIFVHENNSIVTFKDHLTFNMSSDLLM